MKTPTRDECMRILEKEKIPENIIRHSVATAEVAKCLAAKLKKAGEHVDVGMVESAALLHDISKFKCLESDTHHTKDGADALRKMGYGEIAVIVEKHGLDSILNGELKTWEEKIVYYADKRVANDEVVSLRERFECLKRRYPQAHEKLEKAWPLIERLEAEIFGMIGESPETTGLKLEIKVQTPNARAKP